MRGAKETEDDGDGCVCIWMCLLCGKSLDLYFFWLASWRPVQAFFGTIPFEGQAPHLITYWIAKGQRPSRLDSPKMDDETWNLVTNCWLHEPSERPTMSEIVARLMARPESPLTFLITKVCSSRSSIHYY